MSSVVYFHLLAICLLRPPKHAGVEDLCICLMFSEAINSDEVRISLSEGGHPGIL